ncbi:MAG: NAD-dependent epimerase/dehydratase family protein [Solirubrobacterales bacterium]|nr:NAD-dependent epimerase/dehydratase family protein [Solirubrobacterales bacterium]
MRLFVTGGNGVLGQALAPLAAGAGHELSAPSHRELDVFDLASVTGALGGADAVLHLATRIPPRERFEQPEAWEENDRLRTEAARVLVDAALEAGAATFVQPTVAFVYPRETPADAAWSFGWVCSTVQAPATAGCARSTAPPCTWPTLPRPYSRR